MRALRPLGFAALLLMVAVLGLLLWYRQVSLPLHEGTLIVHGLDQTARIERDTNGIPNIVGASEHDVSFALGFAQAQDRLWQMEFNRRLAAGRLSEILGRPALATDQFLRTVGVHRTAQRIYEALDADSRALLDAYVAGVNAYMTTRRGPLPPEFLLTGAPAPMPWTAADSVAWSLMMAWDLASYSMRMELRRLRLSQQMTMTEINDFFPPLPDAAAPLTGDYVEIYRLLGLRNANTAANSIDPIATIPVAGFGEAEGLGSNNWVLAGSRTASGKPLLANDPHLGLNAPSVWYFAALNAPGLNAVGATLPGLPGIVIGRNDRVAWGFTNTGADQQDLYLERINPADPAQYQTPTGWANFETRTERFVVKGEEEIELRVRSTRHGPVISGLESIDKSFSDPRYVLALHWSALEPSDRTIAALRAMNLARSAADFEHAVAEFQVVTQSAVFADVDGTIGFVVTGRIPVRRPDNDFAGVAPAPGWDARYDWQGYLPFADVPRLINPAAGFIATANSRVTPPGYLHHLTHDWFSAFRQQRIEQLIEARPRHDLASMQSAQGDVLSLAALELLSRLTAALPETAAGRDALERLKNWDGRMRIDRPEPLLFHAWMRELKQRVYADDLGKLAPDFVDSADLTRALLHLLAGRARARDWCDDRQTSGRVETCIELAGEALDVAVAQLTRASGRDVAGLRWGEAHQAVAEHRPLSNVAALRWLFGLSTPYPGDTFTVNVGALSHAAEAPFATRHAASLRAIVDLSAPESNSLWVHSTGQAGNPFSPQYSSLQELWRDVKYLPMRTTRGSDAQVLVLVPK